MSDEIDSNHMFAPDAISQAPGSKPSARDAAQIVRAVFDEESETMMRFPTGLCHFVFDVVTKAGRRVVVRIAEPVNRHYLVGAVYWSKMLRPIGVPLPELIAADLDGHAARFPFIVLERLAGTDLGRVYAQLSRAEKQSIVACVVEVQRLVSTLPEGDRFGYATSYDHISHLKWRDVIQASLDRSKSWIAKAGVVRPELVDRVPRGGRAV